MTSITFMKILFYLIIFTALISCNELKEGRILSKEIEPERRYIRLQPIHVGKVMSYIPVTTYDDEDYKIVIEGTTEHGKRKIETFYLSKLDFDCLTVGDHFIVNKSCSTQPNEELTIKE